MYVCESDEIDELVDIVSVIYLKNDELHLFEISMYHDEVVDDHLDTVAELNDENDEADDDELLIDFVVIYVLVDMQIDSENEIVEGHE